MPSLVVPAQIRAGRALLDWSQEQLATAAEVGLSTIRCWRQFKIDHLCQLNFDQGSKAGFVVPGCG